MIGRPFAFEPLADYLPAFSRVCAVETVDNDAVICCNSRFEVRDSKGPDETKTFVVYDGGDADSVEISDCGSRPFECVDATAIESNIKVFVDQGYVFATAARGRRGQEPVFPLKINFLDAPPKIVDFSFRVEGAG